MVNKELSEKIVNSCLDISKIINSLPGEGTMDDDFACIYIMNYFGEEELEGNNNGFYNIRGTSKTVFKSLVIFLLNQPQMEKMLTAAIAEAAFQRKEMEREKALEEKK